MGRISVTSLASFLLHKAPNLCSENASNLVTLARILFEAERREGPLDLASNIGGLRETGTTNAVASCSFFFLDPRQGEEKAGEKKVSFFDAKNGQFFPTKKTFTSTLDEEPILITKSGSPEGMQKEGGIKVRANTALAAIDLAMRLFRKNGFLMAGKKGKSLKAIDHFPRPGSLDGLSNIYYIHVRVRDQGGQSTV